MTRDDEIKRVEATGNRPLEAESIRNEAVLGALTIRRPWRGGEHLRGVDPRSQVDGSKRGLDAHASRRTNHGETRIRRLGANAHVSEAQAVHVDGLGLSADVCP